MDEDTIELTPILRGKDVERFFRTVKEDRDNPARRDFLNKCAQSYRELVVDRQ
jgi:hypothetical protein